MRGDILPLPQYVFMPWCLVKAKGQLYYVKKQEFTDRLHNKIYKPKTNFNLSTHCTNFREEAEKFLHQTHQLLLGFNANIDFKGAQALCRCKLKIFDDNDAERTWHITV
jgi:hypothetical protein